MSEKEIKNSNEEIQEELKDNSKKENLQEENKITKLQTELDDTTDRLKRLMAEFENFKKRSSKEREMLYASILGDIVTKFLPIMDNLQKATEVKTEDENYKKGVELVLQQFNDSFTAIGVEEIKTVGETFDPEVHEAVGSIQDEALGEKEIKEEFRKGYKIGTKVIRHAMVVVAN